MRHLIRRALLVGIFFFIASTLFAAGTATVTTTPIRSAGTRYVKYSIAWTSTAGGAVSGNTFAVVPGTILSVRFVPSAGTAPTDLYDVTLVDTNTVDVLFGAGANLSATLSTVTRLSPAYFQDGSRVLDLVVANAGAAKLGTVEILVQTQ